MSGIIGTLTGFNVGDGLVELAKRGVDALERIADELHTANEQRDLQMNGPRS